MNNRHHQQSNGTNNNITQQQDLSNGNTTTSASASASASAADTNNDTYTYLNDTRINVDDNDIAERISLDDDMSHRNEVEMNELIDDIDDITKNMTTEHEHGHEHEHQHEDEHGQEQDVSDSDVIEDNSIVGFYQHNDSIYCVATYDDYAVTGDGHENHCRAYVWSIVDGRMIQELQAVHTDTIIDIKFSADGRLLATASMDSTIHVYDVTHDFKHLHTLQGPSGEIEFLLFHPHGHVVAAGSSDSTVWMYNADTGDMMHVFTGHLGSVLCGTWSTDGKLLITGSDDGAVYIWNPKTGQPKYPKITHDTPITSITSHPYESLIACGTANGIIQVINTDTGHVVSTYSNAQSTESGGIEGLCYSNNRDMKLIASGHVDGSIYVWDTTNRSTRTHMKHELLMKRREKTTLDTSDMKVDDNASEDSEVSVTHLEFHRSEPYMFTSSLDGTVRMWEARTGQQLAVYSGHHQAVLSFAVNYKHNVIVTASDDHKSLVFPITQQQQRNT